VTKTSGLGDGLIFGSADMSGDVQQLNSAVHPRSTFDFTGIDVKAMVRQTGETDGLLNMTTFFNPGPGATAAHLVARTLPRTMCSWRICAGPRWGPPRSASWASRSTTNLSGAGRIPDVLGQRTCQRIGGRVGGPAHPGQPDDVAATPLPPRWT